LYGRIAELPKGLAKACLLVFFATGGFPGLGWRGI
jgi:hypothetical protein